MGDENKPSPRSWPSSSRRTLTQSLDRKERILSSSIAEPEDSRNSKKDNAQIHPNRPLFNILDIQFKHLQYAESVAAAYLPQTSHARREIMPLGIP